MSRTKWARFARVALAGAAAAAFAATAFTPVTAQAAEAAVDDVTLTWGINAESGGGSFFGGCNFLSAGVAGNSGSSRLWTEADGFYKSTEGNVAIIKDGPDGTTVTPSWATKCQLGNGSAVGTGATSTTNNKAVLTAGTGTVDVEAGTASIAWDGSFSIVYYGGLTYWSVTNPVLTVNSDGTANLKATASGYAASQDGEAAWGPLPSATITLANFTGIQVTESGFEATPLYREVEVSGEGINQVREGANWGAFPQDMVTFNVGTGQAPYWFSSGGSADPKKVAGPLSVAWEIEAEEPTPTPEPTEPGESEDHEVDVEVVVPEPTTPEPGKFEISIAGNANLGEAEVTGAGFVATGALPSITVTDTREDTAGWSVNGLLADFVGDTGGTIMASSLGWTPTSTSDDVQLGAANNPHRPGLVASSLLAQGGAGAHVLSADLKLHALGSTIPGEYTAKLTLTVVS